MVAMTVKRHKSTGGFTLVEAMITILILSIAVIGTSGYRYHAAMDAQKAAMHITAAGVALLLTESWRGVKGDETYDPIAHLGSDLVITTGNSTTVEGFNLLGGYTVVANGVNYYYVTLSWKDVGTELRILNVVVTWIQRDQGQTGSSYADKSFKLTTYTSR